jgi:pyruvate/2-oxoglutarate dehydrogenase complex dihydrolipoamide acyltransferase (E2) component
MLRWQGDDPPGVANVSAPDRKGERPMTYLDGFIDILQVDGYSGYRPLAAENTLSLAFCWSHVRRRFCEQAAAGPAPIASEAQRRIAELHKIEDEIHGGTHEERRTTRQEMSRPITDSLAPWLRDQLGYFGQRQSSPKQSAMPCHAGKL